MIMYWDRQEQASARDCMYILTELAAFSSGSDYQLNPGLVVGGSLRWANWNQRLVLLLSVKLQRCFIRWRSAFDQKLTV